MIETFETGRLSAERLCAGHLPELLRMHCDARVMATLGGVRSDEQTARFLQENLDHWDRLGYGLWTLREGNGGRFVGRAGLRPVPLGSGDEVELAYALMAEYWGKGLATEISRAILRIAFEHIGIEDLVCFTLTTNAASRRVMEKVGFVYEREALHAELPHVFYRLTAEAWQRAHGLGES